MSKEFVSFQDTLILFDYYSVHYDPAYWDHPEEFRPQRFLDKNGQFCQNNANIPFGLGNIRFEIRLSSSSSIILSNKIIFREETMSRRITCSFNIFLIFRLLYILFRFRYLTCTWHTRSKRLRQFHFITETVLSQALDEIRYKALKCTPRGTCHRR